MLKLSLKKSLYILIFITSGYVQAQELDIPLTKLIKVNFINPGIEWQKPLAPKALLSVNAGVGYDGAYPHLTKSSGSGAQVLIASFLDIQSRYYLNRERLVAKQKTIKNNSGSFLVTRFLVRGPSIASSFTRTSDVDMAIGLGYGFQRSKKKFNFAFTVAPYFYFDDKGNHGFFPIIPEFSLGYNIIH